MAHRSLIYYSHSYLTLSGYFRNGIQLAWRHHRYQSCEEASLWNGQQVWGCHGASGFVEALVEVWGTQSYTRDFYYPTNNDVILDIGANVGLFSIWMARQAPRARILAFEPFEEAFHVLKRNLQHWNNRVEIHQTAVGARRAQGQMLTGKGSLDHRLALERQNGSTTQEIQVITLQDTLRLAGANPVDFLKMDIEGSEFDIFSAADVETLRRFRKISLEYHDDIRPGTSAMLRERLASTHEIVSVHAPAHGEGIIRAVLRS